MNFRFIKLQLNNITKSIIIKLFVINISTSKDKLCDLINIQNIFDLFFLLLDIYIYITDISY